MDRGRVVASLGVRTEVARCVCAITEATDDYSNSQYCTTIDKIQEVHKDRYIYIPNTHLFKDTGKQHGRTRYIYTKDAKYYCIDIKTRTTKK